MIKLMKSADIIRALMGRGWTQNRIADAVPTSQPNISRALKEDAGPREPLVIGLNLLAAREGLLGPAVDPEILAVLSKIEGDDLEAAKRMLRAMAAPKA